MTTSGKGFYWQTIAAFDCEGAALAYWDRCTARNGDAYRVVAFT
jgi:hypothetical protein